jgi:hypothetical protein
MRAGEIRALARQIGTAPAVSVLDLCCVVAGPGRFITQELGCTISGWTSTLAGPRTRSPRSRPQSPARQQEPEQRPSPSGARHD